MTSLTEQLIEKGHTTPGRARFIGWVKSQQRRVKRLIKDAKKSGDLNDWIAVKEANGKLPRDCRLSLSK